MKRKYNNSDKYDKDFVVDDEEEDDEDDDDDDDEEEDDDDIIIKNKYRTVIKNNIFLKKYTNDEIEYFSKLSEDE